MRILAAMILPSTIPRQRERRGAPPPTSTIARCRAAFANSASRLEKCQPPRMPHRRRHAASSHDLISARRQCEACMMVATRREKPHGARQDTAIKKHAGRA